MDDFFADNQDDISILKQKMLDLENRLGGLNPRNLGGIRSKDLAQATRANIFGDGSDGDVNMDGTNTYASFASLASTTYTLTRDVFAKNLIIKTGISLDTNGFRVFTTKDLTNGGTIKNTGNDGTNGNAGTNGGSNSDAPGGSAVAGGAAANASASLVASVAGKTSGAGGTGSSGGGGSVGADGTSGDGIGKGLGGAGSGGGAGGRGGDNLNVGGEQGQAGGSGGNGGSVTGTVYNLPRSPSAAYTLADNAIGFTTPASVTPPTTSATAVAVEADSLLIGYISFSSGAGQYDVFVNGVQYTGVTSANGIRSLCVPIPAGSTYYVTKAAVSTETVFLLPQGNQPIRGSAGSGSGAGGGGAISNDTNSRGGGGGSGGGSGSPGGMLVIFASRLINNGTITVNGGNGGNGGHGGEPGGGGGGGGGGGAGGVIILCYGEMTGAGTVTATGGTGGSAGVAGATSGTVGAGVNGTAGTAGTTGTIIEIPIG